MSVVARRRKPRVSGDSEEFSEDSYDDNDVNKGSECDTDLNISSEGQRESEYETLDETGECESDSGDGTAVDDEREDGDLSDSVIVEYEREEGDGQESAPPKEKKLDDDEDRRNPQYIPKRGTFYEHDDRTATEDVDTETVEKDTERNKENEKKKVWKEQENRWSHDRYNEDDQTPKSRDELIAVYGYDIRNEDAPPRARRRRKYGRGPNKYTRNWEDEDAYGKTNAFPPRGGMGRRGGGRGGRRNFNHPPADSEEEFPPLNSVETNRHKHEGGSARSSGNTSQNLQYSNKLSGRGARGNRRYIQFPPLPQSTEPDSETKEDLSKEELLAHINNTNGGHVNPWKKEAQTYVDNSKSRDDTSKQIQITSKNNSSAGSAVSINSNTGRNRSQQGDDKRDKTDESNWKSRRDKNYQNQHDENTNAEVSVNVVGGGGDKGWRGRSRGERRSVHGIPVESQTYTPSAPRGRGRGQRGGGVGGGSGGGVGAGGGSNNSGSSRQMLDFKASLRQSSQVAGARRSLSETRMSSKDAISESAENNSYIKTQVVNRTTDDMVKDIGRMSVNEPHHVTNRDYSRKINKNQPNYHLNVERRQPVVPPRLQDNSGNKPKRYSSQRQRSLPETSGPAYSQPHPYYTPAGYGQQPEDLEGMGVVSSGYVQPPPVYGDAQQQQPPPVVAQPPATTPPLGLLPTPHPQAQAFAAPPFPSPPTFIPPVAGPPPRILPPGAATFMTAAPTGAPIINYVATPAPSQFAPQAFAPYQGFTAVPATQPPPELYQPQGITYYSPEEQIMSRTITQKRQSTAIPIVPPPEMGPRGRGRLREESSVAPAVSLIVDSRAGGDASNAALKEEQFKDAPEDETEVAVKSVPEVDERPDTPTSSFKNNTSSNVADDKAVLKVTVTPEIIKAINVTEIPESSNALEIVKAINVPETTAVSEITSSASTISTTSISDTESTTNTSAMDTSTALASDTEAPNIASLNINATEQEIQV